MNHQIHIMTKWVTPPPLVTPPHTYTYVRTHIQTKNKMCKNKPNEQPPPTLQLANLSLPARHLSNICSSRYKFSTLWGMDKRRKCPDSYPTFMRHSRNLFMTVLKRKYEAWGHNHSSSQCSTTSKEANPNSCFLFFMNFGKGQIKKISSVPNNSLHVWVIRYLIANYL